MSSSHLPLWATAPSPHRFIEKGAIHALLNGQFLLDHPPELIRPLALAAGISLVGVDDCHVSVVACERAMKLCELHKLEIEGGNFHSLN